MKPFLQALCRQSRCGVQAPHGDGYGVAVLRQGHWLHVREQCPVWEAPLSSLSSVRGTLLILHARKASDPATINLAKLHPFYWPGHGQGIMFCQNGTIRHHERLSVPASESLIDTEKYFSLVLTRFQSGEDLASSVVCAAHTIVEARADPTSLNALASDGRQLVGFKGPILPENKGYHTLHVCDTRDISVISTEPFAFSGSTAWQPLDGVCTRTFS
jgi:predicted glutamine amidotransferase